MTRINSAISGERLTDEHLLAEHREIKRLPACLNRSLQTGKPLNIPKRFTLGKGHVTFFYDKIGFVKKRYIQLYQECLRRGFTVTDYTSNFDTVPIEYFNDYVPTEEEKVLLEERIRERFLGSNKKAWHYCRQKVCEPLISPYT